MRIIRRLLLCLALACAFGARARATGLLVPGEKNLPPLAIKSHQVSVKIRDQVAQVHVTQVFQSSVNRDLEASYVFPIPPGAAIRNLVLYIGGKAHKGEVLDAAEANRIYEDIVRRARDPGLLEYYGSDLLRVKIYPIPRNGTQKIEVKYDQTLKMDDGVVHFRFPLKTGHKASRVMDALSCAVSLKSRRPISTVYSPTHKISVARKGDNEAEVGYEEESGLLDTDFDLYWSVDKKDVGLGLITTRPEGKNGYFLMMMAPRVEIPEGKMPSKDVCFVLDTSGSMEGEKLQRAKEALSHCLKALKPKDRFKLVRFSTSVEAQSKELMPANPENVKTALEFVKGLDARGGTNIDGALAEALDVRPESVSGAAWKGRIYIIVFLTDGKPTVGAMDTEEIIGNLKQRNKTNTRVFTFGIDETVNVKLLDKITEITHGYSEYVKPNEEIEMKVSSFFNKAGHPVLTNLKLDLPEKLGAFDIYPQTLPDLFKGMQIILMGRYKGDGDFAVKLTGEVDGKKREFVYEGGFEKKSEENDFIAGLWALRKIGYLMDQIRLHGEEKELVDEVVRLSKEYNIVTPYTSSLVLEDTETYRRYGLEEPAAKAPGHGARGAVYDADVAGGGRARFQRATKEVTAAEAQEWVADNLEEKREAGAAGYAQPRYARDKSGSRAIASSKVVRNLATNSQIEVQRALQGQYNQVARRRFLNVGDYYVDEDFKESMKQVNVRWGSEAYFQLARANTELRQCLAQGNNVTVVFNNQAIVVRENTGKEELTDKEIKAILGK